MGKQRKDTPLEWPEEEAQRLANEAGYIAFLETMPRKNEDDDQDDEKREAETDDDEKH